MSFYGLSCFNCTLHGCGGRIVATIASKQTIQLLTVTLDLVPDVLQDSAAAILSVNLVQNRGNASLLIHLAFQSNLVEHAMTKLMITTNWKFGRYYLFTPFSIMINICAHFIQSPVVNTALSPVDDYFIETLHKSCKFSYIRWILAVLLTYRSGNFIQAAAFLDTAVQTCL